MARAKATTTTKKKKTQPKVTTPRIRDVPKHRSFRMSTSKLKQVKKLPTSRTLLKQSFKLMFGNKRLLLGLIAFNAVLSFIFVQGFSSSFDMGELKTQVEEIFNGTGEQIGTGLVLFGYLLQSAGSSTSQTGGAYQLFLTVVTSLAVIWSVRQLLAGEKPRFRDSLYSGMYPLIPFIIVLFVIGLQFIPLLIGNVVYTTVVSGGLAVTTIEKAVWILLFATMALLTVYMVLSSMFALYISTLPQMTPLSALRSARELVVHRRLQIIVRLIALIVIMLLVSAVVFIPLLLFFTVAAQILFVAMTSFALVFAHVYLYLLYRELI